MSILRNLCAKQGITVIASLHDVDIAAKVSDQVALVKDGRITGWGSPEDILGPDEVADLYDFDSASFNRQLGSIELRGEENREKVFVIGGMGRGAAVFRLLAKRGYQVRTGVLFNNDLDYFVAESLKIPCASQQPAAEISKRSLEEAASELAACDWVVDAGFDETSIYKNNLQLFEKAASLGKPVFSVADGDNTLTGFPTNTVLRLKNISELPTAMEQSI
jgi:iron complex transport system ATP-binding protein